MISSSHDDINLLSEVTNTVLHQGQCKRQSLKMDFHNYEVDPDYYNYHYYFDNTSKIRLSQIGKMFEVDNLASNSSKVESTVLGEEFPNDDAAWVMANCLLIFTMQTGFGLYESGTY